MQLDAVKATASIWPTAEQTLLLQATLLEGSETIEAWREWQARVDPGQLDGLSHRLLPLLYQNLRKQGIRDDQIGSYKAAYQRTWFKNQLVLHDLVQLLPHFHDAGIQTLALKGVALTVQYYHDYGLRPMKDFDILVRTENASAAVGLLTRLGWTQGLRPLEAFDEAYFSAMHSHDFRDAGGRSLDLHWHVLRQCSYPGADIAFWEGAVPIKVQGVPTLTLNPTDQLLHTCIHGARIDPAPALHWIADALVVLRSAGSEIEWDRLVEQARDRRLLLEVRNALAYLQAEWGAPVPAGTLRNLQAMPVSRLERLEYRMMTRPRGLTGYVLPDWFHYRRSLRGTKRSWTASLLGFPIFLQNAWHLGHAWQVPFDLIRSGIRRIWERITPTRRDRPNQGN